VLRRLFSATDVIESWWGERDDVLVPWFWWTFAGVAAAGVLVTFLGFWDATAPAGFLLAPVALSALPAIGQRRVLGQRLASVRWWFRGSVLGGLAGTAGYFAGIVIEASLRYPLFPSVVGWLALLFCTALIPAAAQWLVLRKLVRHASWWLISAVMVCVCVAAAGQFVAAHDEPTAAQAPVSPGRAPDVEPRRRDESGNLLSRATGRRIGLIPWLLTGAVVGAAYGLPSAAISSVTMATLLSRSLKDSPGHLAGAGKG
jgi:hypothetical protein